MQVRVLHPFYKLFHCSLSRWRWKASAPAHFHGHYTTMVHGCRPTLREALIAPSDFPFRLPAPQPV